MMVQTKSQIIKKKETSDLRVRSGQACIRLVITPPEEPTFQTINLRESFSFQFSLILIRIRERKEMSCGRLNASWKISSSAVDGQSFLVIDGSLLN